MFAPFANALSGLQRASDMFARSASRIANIRTPGANTDLAAEFVNMSVAKYDFRANVAVLDAGTRMIGALLDLRA